MLPSLSEVLAIRQKPISAQPKLVGNDPKLMTRFRLGEVAASVIAGIGVAADDIWCSRGGRPNEVQVDVARAAAGLSSTVHMQLRNQAGQFENVPNPDAASRLLTQPWPTKDGRWFLPHFSLPNLRERVLKVLGCDADPQSVAKAVSTWDALDLEAAIDEARACGAMVRTNEEWLAHPHGQGLVAKPIVEIEKIADGDPQPFPQTTAHGRALQGTRVLDLTRILAGPIAARTLAEHGAEVLMVAEKNLPQTMPNVMDTSHGKRSCFLNLKSADGAQHLRHLLRDADVFSQGYRPGMLAQLGFAAEEVAAQHRGIVYVSISCFGAGGPFSHRAGWEQVAQTVTGICNDGKPDQPALLPAAACDYTTGYLAAYGALLALGRRAVEGGSYHVRVSLCQSGMFIYRQGQAPAPGPGLSEQELDLMRVQTPTSYGIMRHLAPILQLSESPPHWSRPTPQFGGDRPLWLAH